MSCWQWKLLGRAITYTLATIFVLVSFFGIMWLMWPRFGSDAVLIAAGESWLLCFWWVSPLVKLEMWITRPRPIKTWERIN